MSPYINSLMPLQIGHLWKNISAIVNTNRKILSHNFVANVLECLDQRLNSFSEVRLMWWKHMVLMILGKKEVREYICFGAWNWL